MLLISACNTSAGCVTINRIDQIENTYIAEKGESFVDDLRIYKSVAALSVDQKDTDSPYIMASGFAVSKTLIFSAGHFCLAAHEGPVKGKLKEKINMTVVVGNRLAEKKEILKIKAIDEATDLCILESEGNHGLIPLRLQRKYFKNVYVGQKVYTVGNPLGVFPAKSVGYVILPKSNDPDPIAKNRMFINISISFGNSGSPVIGKNGRIIGMIVAGEIGSDITIAVRSDVMIKFLMSVK